ncbi:asparagine synthetase [Ostreococcus tauri]|uniref:asparagine synthase (glutamine-hydrolyzing) n=1 Tax=Ostreococcus tauri TaxID=70448 RepID=A0A1Y5I6H8_OSTTA|nr:asparagine synthetase [Ostreococcus tauri]
MALSHVAFSGRRASLDMCGIFAVLRLTGDARKNRRRVYDLAKRLRHRGPDSYGMEVRVDERSGAQTFMVHKRLSIVAPGKSGDQPLYTDASRKTTFIANGEIYNHAELREKYGIVSENKSDCQVIGHLYEQHGPGFVSELDGMFAFVIEDRENDVIVAARDHMGKIPMYMANGKDGSVWFSSEMKTLHDDPGVASYEIFPPGHVYVKKGDEPATIERWFNPQWIAEESYVPTTPADLPALRECVVDAVTKRLMADVPYAVLLSGGLDSSLITSIAVRQRKLAKNTYGADEPVHSFSIGIKGAPDLVAARKVAEQLGTIHHEVHFTPEEALDALPDVIWHLETFEQVRASVPMYLLSRHIKSLGFKMVLSGEGADELFGGYLYFHKAPNPTEFHAECRRKTMRLHQWDVLRANKSTMSWGIEQVIDMAMNMRPEDKMIDVNKKDADGHPFLEKYILRKAFDTPEDPYLPQEVLWRQKEQFSDGVGYDWVDGLAAHAELEVSDEMFAKRAERFPLHPPTTKEYYLLRSIFEEHFVTGFENGDCAYATCPFGKSIACSTPEAVSWDPEWEKSVGDISGRAVKNVHVAADKFDVKKEKANETVAASLVGVQRRGVTVKPRARKGVVQQRVRGHVRFAGLRAAPISRVLLL